MFMLSDAFKKIHRRVLLAILLACGVAGSPAFAAACAGAVPIDLGTTWRGFGAEPGQTELFIVDVPARGVLTVYAATPNVSPAEPKLASLDESCRPTDTVVDGLRVIDSSVGGLTLEVQKPGTYFFAVAAQNRRTPLGDFKLTTRFASTRDLCEGVSAALKTHVDPELDPDLLAACLAKTHVDPELDPDLTSVGNAALCAPGDDRADDLPCATPLAAGRSLAGDLDNDWGDDADVYSFSLARQRTVTLEAHGDANLTGALYDRHGDRLMTDDGDTGAGLRLVRTLEPGRYFVRIEGDHGAEGVYELTLTVEAW